MFKEKLEFVGKIADALQKSAEQLEGIVNYREEQLKNKKEEVKKSVKEELDFKFLIEKAYVVDKDGNKIAVPYNKFEKGNDEGAIDLDNMYIEGIASTTNVDHDGERMSPEAIDEMVKQINESKLPLVNEHQKTWDSQLGDIMKAWKDERNQVYIQAKLDKDNSRAIDLYKALKKGLQVGLSVAGLVKRSAQEFVESLGKQAKTFHSVILKEISVTNRPSNFDTWIIAKGGSGTLEEHLFRKPHPFYEDYLISYPSLDWQCVIAKSVAEVSNIMADETKKEVAVEQPKDEVVTTLKLMTDSFKSLSQEIKDFLAKMSVAKEAGSPSETEEETTDETTVETKGAKKSTKKAVKKEATATEEETTDEETTDETEKSFSELGDSEKKAMVKVISSEIRKSMAKEGKRLVGPLEEAIEKMMSLPLKRKGVANEKAYVMEKSFTGNSEKEEQEVEKKEMKNESFQDYFKKNLSSFRGQGEE